MSEPLLKNKIRAELASDFEILEEVTGKHLISAETVRIDFMLRAKPHLLIRGFTNEWFGVECKWIEDNNGQTAKVTKTVWQSITYAQSAFFIENENVTPAFVLVNTPNNIEPRIEVILKSQLALALYGRVGRLEFYRDDYWVIKFAQIYYSSSNGDAKQSLIPKNRVGNI